MAAVPRRFPLVITTNSGFPLDQNLYQSVKGMSAAAEIIADNGEMIVAARCNDGFPAHGNFTKLLYEHNSPQAILDTIFGSSVAEHGLGDSSAAEDGPWTPPACTCWISGRPRSSPKSRCGRRWRYTVNWSRTRSPAPASRRLPT